MSLWEETSSRQVERHFGQEGDRKEIDVAVRRGVREEETERSEIGAKGKERKRRDWRKRKRTKEKRERERRQKEGKKRKKTEREREETEV
jgi:hypothetical protein